MAEPAEDPEVLRQADPDPARLRERFLALYSGSWDPLDAFDWSRDPDSPSAAGSPAPLALLREQRANLYRRGASDAEVHAFLEREQELERELAEARATVLRASLEPPGPSLSGSGETRTAHHRRAALVAVVAVGLAAAIAAGSMLGLVPRSSGAAPPTHHLTAVSLRLLGSTAQIASLRGAIDGDSEGPDALVTATALQQVTVLRTASAISESDLTATGHGVIAIPDLDEFSPQRHATVLVFCQRSTTYDWTMTAYGVAGTGPSYTAVGHGANCSTLSYITVPLPPGVHRFTLTARVDGPVRFLIEVHSTS